MSKLAKKIIIFLIIGIFILIFFSMKILSKETEKLKLEQSIDEDINRKIITLTKQNYPTEPEEVLDIYLEGYGLIYGKYMTNVDVINYIISKQRLLLSDSILNLNSEQNQKNNIITGIQHLIEQGFEITNITMENFILDENSENSGSIKVIKTDNNNENYEFIYYLEKDKSGNWKISGWENNNNKYQVEIE